MIRIRIIAPVLGVTYLVLPNWFDPINIPKLTVLLTTIPLFAWEPTKRLFEIFASLDKRRRFMVSALIGSPFFALIAGSMNGFDFSMMFGTWGRNNGILSLVALMLLALSFLYYVNQRQTALAFLRWSALIVGLSGVYGLLQYFDRDPIQWVNSGSKLIGFFGNSNFASSVWACGAGISVLLLAFESRNIFKFSLLGNYLFLSFLSFKTESIQGPLLILVFTILAIYFYLKFNHTLKTIFLVFISVVGFTLFLSGLMGYGPLRQFLNTTSVIARFKYWEAAWNMFYDNIFFGVGVDQYGENFRTYRSNDAAATLTIDLTTNNAHNSILHLLSTLGIFGAGTIVLFLLITATVSVFSIVSRHTTDIAKIYSSLYLGMFLMSLFSIDNLSVAVWIWIFMGGALGSSIFVRYFNDDETRVTPKRKSNQSVPQTPLVALTASCVLFASCWLYAYPERSVVSILNTPVYSNDLQSLESRKEKLLELHTSPFFQAQHGIVSMQALNEMNFAEDAIDLGIDLITKNPKNFAVMNYLALLLEQNRRYPEAIDVRKKQILLDHRHGGVWLAIAFDSREAGLIEQSQFALNQARKNAKYMGENFEARIRTFFP